MLKVQKFVTGPLRSNTYLVYKDGAAEAALIDPMRGKERIKAFAANLGLKITSVLITHGHFDHCLEARDWQQEGAKVTVHEADAERLNGGQNLGAVFGVVVPPCKADILVKDGDRIVAAGIDFKVIHTPGHSPGSCCYLTETCLFSGDTLFAGTVGRTDFEGGSYQDILQSVQKLFALQGDYTVYPGHEDTTTLQRERNENCTVREIQD